MIDFCHRLPAASSRRVLPAPFQDDGRASCPGGVRRSARRHFRRMSEQSLKRIAALERRETQVREMTSICRRAHRSTPKNPTHPLAVTQSRSTARRKESVDGLRRLRRRPELKLLKLHGWLRRSPIGVVVETPLPVLLLFSSNRIHGQLSLHTRRMCFEELPGRAGSGDASSRSGRTA